MRKGVVLRSLTAALGGAAIAVAGVLAAYWWTVHRTPAGGEFGWYAYSPPRRYASYVPAVGSVDWVGLVVPAAVAGAVLGLLLASAVRFTYVRLVAGRERNRPRVAPPGATPPARRGRR